MIAVRGERFLLVGAGVTGTSVARFLRRRGALVRVVERDPQRVEGLPDGVTVAPDEDDPRVLADVVAVIPSPGVDARHALLQRAVREHIPVISEIELASRFLDCPLIGITGTNGKSTTTVVVGEALRRAGRRVFVGGNLGTPLIAACDEEFDFAVVEISSFQLEWVSEFRPSVAVVLNVTPDHLDRYENFSSYACTKARLLARQGPNDAAVLNRDDPVVWAMRERTAGRVVSFGHRAGDDGVVTDGETITLRLPDGAPVHLALSAVGLTGPHNRENLMAAAAAATLCGAPAQAVQAAIDAAQRLPHRLELVGERGGVRFFDDSKATNVGAVARALESFRDPVIWLAGGYDKGSDFHSLAGDVRERVKEMVCFGAAASKVAGALGEHVPHRVVATLEAAVRAAIEAAAPGDVVLLSPGGASFDEFRNYAERGEQFRKLVEES